ncbi:hypothetical protein [Corynebacterium dentalis]|uniref:hypothetical protein n=1 Tax=Corynebacterium dentalis TaxID=2014528 RepID=UPI00370D7AAD
MTEQTISAEKVRGVISEIDDCLDGTYLNDQARRALEAAKVSMENILPAPPQPTTGLLGRWAKSEVHGDVLVVSDRTFDDGEEGGLVVVAALSERPADGKELYNVPLDSLTFPEQATRPEDVPAGEAWRIRDTEGNEFNAVKTSSGYYTTDRSGYTWLFCDHDGNGHWLKDKEATLVCPLTPERPASDLQAKYDELEQKYAELDRKYFDLSVELSIEQQANGSRNDWGDEQPAWRIEHDHMNIRVGEYIIDKAGDGGTVTHASSVYRRPRTNGSALCLPLYAPWIVFPNKDAATPEAIEEAKRARDKEMDK